MGVVADALIPKEPWEYALAATGPGGRIASMLPKAMKGGLLALGIGSTASETEAGPAGIVKKGLSLASNPFQKPPPLVAVGHGTASPAEYARPKLPPPEHDLGIHSTIDPSISSGYSNKQVPEGTVDFMSGLKFGDPGTAEPRIKPFLMDAQSALKYPQDAIKWNDPDRVIEHLEESMRRGFSAPRGLLSDMYNIGGTKKTWQDQFVPMLQDKGYDSIWYPHYSDTAGTSPYNTFMAFDPKQMTPRFSPEGQALIKERGVKEKPKVSGWDPDSGTFTDIASWRLPKGILKPEGEVESLVKSHTLNTRPWWDDPNSSLSKIDEKFKQKQAEAEKQYKKWQAGNVPSSPGYGMNDAAVEKLMGLNEQLATKQITPTEYDLAFHELKNSNVYKSPFDLKIHMADQEQYKLHDQLKKGKISEAEYYAEYNKLEAKKDEHFGGILANAPKKPIENYPTGVMDKYKSYNADELVAAHKAGKINDGLYKKLLNNLADEKIPGASIQDKLGWLKKMSKSTEPKNPELGWLNDLGNLFSPSGEIVAESKELKKSIAKFIKDKKL